jgi:hypothetical protein
MKGIDNTGAPLVHVPGWMKVKAVLRIAYSNQKHYTIITILIINHKNVYGNFLNGLSF